MVQQAAKRQPKTTFNVSISISFVPISRPFRMPRCYVRVYLGDVSNDTQRPRSVRLLRVVSPFDFSVWYGRRRRLASPPSWFSHRFAHTLQSSLSQVRFHRMTIAQRTTLEPATPLSNSEALVTPRTPTTTCTSSILNPLFFSITYPSARHGRNLDGHRLSIQVCSLPISPNIYRAQLT